MPDALPAKPSARCSRTRRRTSRFALGHDALAGHGVVPVADAQLVAVTTLADRPRAPVGVSQHDPVADAGIEALTRALLGQRLREPHLDECVVGTGPRVCHLERVLAVGLEALRDRTEPDRDRREHAPGVATLDVERHDLVRGSAEASHRIERVDLDRRGGERVPRGVPEGVVPDVRAPRLERADEIVPALAVGVELRRRGESKVAVPPSADGGEDSTDVAWNTSLLPVNPRDRAALDLLVCSERADE